MIVSRAFFVELEGVCYKSYSLQTKFCDSSFNSEDCMGLVDFFILHDHKSVDKILKAVPYQDDHEADYKKPVIAES